MLGNGCMAWQNMQKDAGNRLLCIAQVVIAGAYQDIDLLAPPVVCGQVVLSASSSCSSDLRSVRLSWNYHLITASDVICNRQE